jgi:NAD(P)-dependent dehydrogenase (short-subunit alcohol dehydrogenase family)
MASDDGLRARVALVTGGARGIGRAIAVEYGRLGASVAVVDVDDEGARQVAAQVEGAGGRASAHHLDVGDDEDAIDRTIADIGARLGPVTVLVNNAAVMGSALSGHDGSVGTTSRDVWTETLAVNLVGPAMLAKSVLPTMVESPHGGCIINIGSAGAGFGDERNVAYRASKAALVSLTRSLAVSHGRQGVRTNAISPGVVLTEGTLGQATEAALDVFRRSRTVPDAVLAEEVAALAVFLASDAARSINGQTYLVDGGMSILPPWFAALSP